MSRMGEINLCHVLSAVYLLLSFCLVSLVVPRYIFLVHVHWNKRKVDLSF